MQKNRAPSLCQNHLHSCGSCCGLWNFSQGDLPWEDYKIKIGEILLNRTAQMATITANFSNPRRSGLFQYAKEQSLRESKNALNRPDIHICPFLGYLPNNRIGCLLHPDLWGHLETLDLRDLSFYGKSICAEYNCPGKQSLPIKSIKFLDKIFSDPLDYGAAIADYRLLKILLSIYQSCARSKNKDTQRQLESIRTWFSLGFLWRWRHQQRGFPLCSFEVTWEDSSFYQNNVLNQQRSEKEWRNLQDSLQFLANQFRLTGQELLALLEALHTIIPSQIGLEILADELLKYLHLVCPDERIAH